MHERFVAVATRLIKANGRAAQLVKRTSVAGEKPWRRGSDESAPTTSTEVPITVVQTMLDNSDIDGELVRTTDRMFLMDSSVIPDTGDRIIDGEAELSIVRVVTIAPADTVIISKVQARL